MAGNSLEVRWGRTADRKRWSVYLLRGLVDMTLRLFADGDEAEKFAKKVGRALGAPVIKETP